MLDLNYEETISNIAAPAGHDILVYEDTGPGVPQFSAINLTLTTNNIGVSPNVELNQRSVIKNALNAGNNNSNPLTPSNPWVTSGFNAIQFFNTSGAFGDDEYGGIDFVEGTDDPTPGQNFTFFVGDPANDLRSKDISTISGMDSGKTYTIIAASGQDASTLWRSDSLTFTLPDAVTGFFSKYYNIGGTDNRVMSFRASGLDASSLDFVLYSNGVEIGRDRFCS